MSWCHWGSGVLVPAGGFTWSHHSKTQGLAHTGTWCSAGTGAPLRALFVLISHCWKSLTVSPPCPRSARAESCCRVRAVAGKWFMS